jgi:myo-inositol-1-phosphate synthase
MFHKSIFQLLVDRGVKVDESYQLDIGGGTESLNALDKPRYEAKRRIKNEAVGSVVPYKFPLVAGTSDYVDFMKNSRMSYFWIKGRCFAGAPFTVDMYLHIVDGPAGAGTLVDVVRLAKLAMDRKLSGALKSPSAFAFKMPPAQAKPHVAQLWLEEFIAGKRRD